MSQPARQVLDSAREAGELGHGQPVAIVDKRAARLWVFGADGKLAGETAVLVGQQPGDFSVPGIGERPVEQIKPHERTTPAGRFESHPGRVPGGETNVWLDYDAAIAIHRLRPGAAHDRRARSLATATPDDNRASYGCVIVPVKFYETVVAKTLGRQRGVVYVLPETPRAQATFERTLRGL